MICETVVEEEDSSTSASGKIIDIDERTKHKKRQRTEDEVKSVKAS